MISQPFNKIKRKNQYWFYWSLERMVGDMSEQKIKQDSSVPIGANIRAIRKNKGVGQTELVIQLQLIGINMTRETLVKIERGIQHIQASQLRGIRDVLQTTYDELLK